MTRHPKYLVRRGRPLYLFRWFLLSLLYLFLAGCSQEITDPGATAALPILIPAAQEGQQTPTLASSPTLTALVATPNPTGSIIPDSGWEEVHNGLERRVVNSTGPDGESAPTLYILRIDPEFHRFEVGYHPGEPQSLLGWGEESGALVVVNGGYYTEEYIATSLVVSHGDVSGTSYQGFGGMFSVDSDGPRLRWLNQEPYEAAESLSEGLQSFPMLVTPGGKHGYKDETGEKARRTVIAEDIDGRILIIISPSATFTLAEMSRYLTDSDLDIDAALNLDGGASTGLLLSNPSEGIPAFNELPLVLLVYPR
jgi:hypothetical protein